MIEKFFEYFIAAKDKTLHFNLVALDVYGDLIESIAKDEKLTDYEARRDALENQLISRYDETKDDFVKVVIGYSLVTGHYFMRNGLSAVGKLQKYQGSRFREFADFTANGSLTIAKMLIEAKTQYGIINGLLGVTVNTIDKKKRPQFRKELLDIVLRFDIEVVRENAEAIAFLIPAINYLIDDKVSRKSELLDTINKLIDVTVSFGDTAPTIRSQYNQMGFDCVFNISFESKIKWYQKKQDKDSVKEVARQFAKVYEDLAEKRIILGDVNLEAAIKHLESAVQVYMRYELQNSSELKNTKARLDEIKNRANESFNHNSVLPQKNLLDYLSAKEKKHLDSILSEFKNIDVNEQIHRLLQTVSFTTKDEVQKARQLSKEANQFFEVFPTIFTNEIGQIIFEDNTAEAKESLALFKHIQFTGATLWIHLLEILHQEKLSIDFTDLVSENKILSRRLYLVNRAFTLFFEGDIYACLYLLVPQVEWWFREIAREAGEQTSNLQNFPIEQSKTLTPIFDTEALKEYLGNDVHWLFKQLMMEEPMNVRNKIAHGLELNDNGYCSYFVLCVMKLILEKRKL